MPVQPRDKGGQEMHQLRLRNVRVLRPMVHLYRPSPIRCCQVRTKARNNAQIPGREEKRTYRKFQHSNQLSQDTNQSAYNQELEKSRTQHTTQGNTITNTIHDTKEHELKIFTQYEQERQGGHHTKRHPIISDGGCEYRRWGWREPEAMNTG